MHFKSWTLFAISALNLLVVSSAIAQSCGSVSYTCTGAANFKGDFNLIQDPTPIFPGLQKTCQGAGYYIVNTPSTALGGLVSLVVGKAINEPRNFRVCFAWAAALPASVSDPVSASMASEKCFRLVDGEMFQLVGTGRANSLSCNIKAKVN